ncbi:MAG: serine/threonine-protein phosphatase [Candidatus Solibacter usitatus]|nr:serine/threonine-protein phosphatase [Candidatus Solibacter usitatus]
MWSPLIRLLLFASMANAADTIAIKSIEEAEPLAGTWKFSPGDDPRWAQPAFDDSRWDNMHMPGPVHSLGRGYYWYRFRFTVSASGSRRPLFLSLGPLAMSYEIYCNGVKIGSYGGRPGTESGLRLPEPAVHALPAGAIAFACAVRAWWPSTPFFLAVTPDFASALERVGTEASVGNLIRAWRLEQLYRNAPFHFMNLSILLAGLYFLLLTLWVRREREYLWFGLILFLVCAMRQLWALPLPEPVSVRGVDQAYTVLGGCLFVAWIKFMEELFQTQIPWMIRAVFSIALINVLGLCNGAWLFRPDLLPESHVFMMATFLVVFTLAYVASSLRTQKPWRQLLPLATVQPVLVAAGAPMPALQFQLWGMLFEMRSLTLFFMGVGMAILLNQRAGRQARDQERLKLEMRAAAEVQSLLLNASKAQMPGYEITSVYAPASEVGGDFYQVAVLDESSSMVVVGDVSGKGLKAAMMVSMIVGLLQRETGNSPSAVLRSLNGALAMRQSEGFVTCCCAVFHADGRVVMANAGHLSPYRNGEEIQLPSGLPLGIRNDQEYSEEVFQLAADDVMTLLSDGVVEAANAKGELFGFDRTAAISGKSANEIAEAAKAWGQNDDITVVTVRRRV